MTPQSDTPISQPITKGPVVKLKKQQTDANTNPRPSASKDSGFVSTFEGDYDKDRLNLIPFIDEDADEVKVGRRYKLVTQPSTDQDSNAPVLPIRLFRDDQREPLINRDSLELSSSPSETHQQSVSVVTSQPVSNSNRPVVSGIGQYLQVGTDDNSRRSSVRSEEEFSQVFQVIRQNDSDILVMKQLRERSQTPLAEITTPSIEEPVEIREPLATSSPLPPNSLKFPVETTVEEIISTRQNDDKNLIWAAEQAEKILDRLNVSSNDDNYRSGSSTPRFKTPKTPPSSSANLVDLDGEENDEEVEVQTIRNRIAQLQSTLTVKTFQISRKSMPEFPPDYVNDDFSSEDLRRLTISSETGEGAQLIDNSTRLTCSPHDFQVKQEFLTHLSHMLIDDCREFHSGSDQQGQLNRYYMEVPEYDDSVSVPVLKLRSDGLCKLKEEEKTVVYRF